MDKYKIVWAGNCEWRCEQCGTTWDADELIRNGTEHECREKEKDEHS